MKKALLIKNIFRAFSTNSQAFAPIKLKESKINNVWINASVLKSKSSQELIEIASQNLSKMNFINICTTFKTLLKYESQLTFSSNQAGFLNSLMEKALNMSFFHIFSETDARSISNLYFYFNKLCENPKISSNVDFFTNGSSEKLNRILEEKALFFIDKMNDQETSNVIYTMSKLKNPEKLLVFSDRILTRIDTFSFKSNLMIFYSYASSDIKVPFLYKKLDNWFISTAKLEKMSGQDFSQLIFAYSKIAEIIPESLIFEKFNKIYVFFYEEINIIGLSAILHSLTRFERPLMCQGFYEKYQAKILANFKDLTDRLLSNIIRGYGKWNYGTDVFYIKLEEKCIERCEFLDEKSYSTILHAYASNYKGSFKFYSAFERNLMKKYVEKSSNLSNNNLIFIFYSFTHIKDTFNCSKETQDFFKKIIVERLEQFNIDEIAPMTALYSSYFKDNEEYFVVLKKLLLGKNSQFLKIRNISEITKSFAIHAFSLFDEELISYFLGNLLVILEKDGKKQKEMKNVGEMSFFQDLGKILYSLLKYENIGKHSDVYQKAADLLEEMCKENPENALVLFQEESVGFFFKQSLIKMNIKIEFLKKFLKG